MEYMYIYPSPMQALLLAFMPDIRPLWLVYYTYYADSVYNEPIQRWQRRAPWSTVVDDGLYLVEDYLFLPERCRR